MVVTSAEVEAALRSNADSAVAQFSAELAALLPFVAEWSSLALSVVLGLARAGVDDEIVLQFLDRVGPLNGYEDDWRHIRIAVLRELELHRAAGPGIYNATAIEEVAASFASAGVELREAYRFALKQSRVAGLTLRSPGVVLGREAQALLFSMARPALINRT